MSSYITKEGMVRLQQRLQELVEFRPQVISQVVTAREMGDLSENAEYHAAREKQRHVDREIEHIKRRMTMLKVIDTSTLPKDAVRFGAYLTMMELPQGTINEYRLVGVDEVYERDDGLILMSVESPIGKAMIGKKAGNQVTVTTPKGNRLFEIIAIK